MGAARPSNGFFNLISPAKKSFIFLVRSTNFVIHLKYPKHSKLQDQCVCVCVMSSAAQSPSRGHAQTLPPPNTSRCTLATTIIGVYDLPPLPTQSLTLTSTNSSPVKASRGGGSAAGDHPAIPLPVIILSVPGERPWRTSLPTSRHPTRSSFRYDQKQTFHPTFGSSDSANSVVKVSVVIPGDGLRMEDFVVGGCEIDLGGVRVGEEVDHLFTLIPSPAVSDSAGNSAASNSAAAFTTTPTLRLKLLLHAPLRAPVSSFFRSINIYFAAVDKLTDSAGATVGPIFSKTKSVVLNKYAVIPAVPITIAVACSFPLFAGAFVVGFPIFLPLLAFFLLFLGAAGVLGVGLSASTRRGRVKAAKVFEPLKQGFRDSSVGQRLLYDVGPCPDPVSLARFIIPKDMWHKLLVSLAVDFIGSCR